MKTTMRISFLALLLFCAVPSLFAWSTGKIIGKITDAQTGEPLPNVNVLVVGTTRGALTDFDGKYSIIGVPLGLYTVRASLVGYQESQVTGVKVGADETTPLNFKLTSTAVEMKGVTVSADMQMVNSLTTSGTQTVSAKSIEQIPNVKDVQDVVSLQAGVVKQGKNIFLRGGRANEVQYLVDGVPSNSIVGNTGGSLNSDLAEIAAGMKTGTIGGGGLAVSANAIQSVSVQTSGFDADYGNAQSGVVNIVTKSGGDKYTAALQLRTDRIAGDNQNETYTSISFGGPEPISKYVLPGLGAKIPGTLTFFMSTDIDRSDGVYTFDGNEFYNPLKRRVELKGFLGGLLNGLGFNYQDNQSNAFTFNSKLKYDPSSSDQFSYGYRASLASTHPYDYRYKFLADSSALGANLSTQHVLSWTHFFGTQTFIRMNFGKLMTRDGNDVAGLKPYDYSPILEQRDPNGDAFLDLGTQQRWYSSLTNVYSYRFDFNSQIHPLHLFKTGVEFYYEEIQSTEIENPTAPLRDGEGNLVYPPFPEDMRNDKGQYSGYGHYRWHMNNYPNRGALYVQDNIEFAGLNLHVGIRYDYFDLGKAIFEQDFIDAWSSATLLEPEWVDNRKGESSFGYYALHGDFSPRLSIGYPVTDRIVFYFNYGHFLQFPDRDNYFRDPFTIKEGTLVGNPDLKPQRTVAYESGFENQFSDEMAFAVRAFYKDIFDYPRTVSRGDVNIFRNLDYASARGFEITFNQTLSTNLSSALTYTYQLAKGRSSNPLSSIYSPEFELPRETRLDWDQNHTLNFFASYRVSPLEEGTFFGLPFINNYGLSLTWAYGSGFPYTPAKIRETARTVYLVNNNTQPYTSTINLSIYKGFYVMDRLNLLVTFDVTNLLDRQNVLSVFDVTGAPNSFGDVAISTNETIPWYRTAARLSQQNLASPRQILLGLKLNWE